MVIKHMETKDALLCIPSSHFVFSSIVDTVNTFAQHGVESKVYASNRVDFNRSLCMDYFLNKSDKEYLFMLDSDVLPQTEFNKMIQIVDEDLKRFDIVLAPLFSPAGKWLTMPDPPSLNAPYEVQAGSLGFMVMTKETAHRLTPVGYYTSFGNTGTLTPLFFRYTEDTSEDSDFIRRVKGQKMSIVADPRIRLLHVKFLPVVPPSVDEGLLQILKVAKVPARINGNIIVLDVDFDKTIYVNGVDLMRNEKTGQYDQVYVSSVIIDNDGVLTNNTVNKSYSVNEFIKFLTSLYATKK